MSPRGSGQPRCKSTTIVAYREAVLELGGRAAFESVLRGLPPATRAATEEGRLLPALVPVAWVIDWANAIWEGPAGRDRERYNRHLHAQVRLGFGRLQSALLRVLSARQLVERAPTFWERQHTHGVLTAATEERSGVLTLVHHPYVETPQARATVAEVFRFLVTLTGARNVQEVHRQEKDRLVVRLTWD